MNPLTQRAMGAYYTPDDASAWMAQWLLVDGVTSVLEPTSGDGSFVNAVIDAAIVHSIDPVIHAVELDDAALRLLPSDDRVNPIHADFHDVTPFAVDAVIGNPPFVRFRHLPTAAARESAMRSGARALGDTRIDSAGSIWMTVVLHAATFLRPGGRLAFVLPADALYVKYARPFWAFMSDRFGSLRVVRCRERVFADILQDVVVLFADRAGSSTTVIESELYASRTALTLHVEPERMQISLGDLVNGEKPFAKALLGHRFGAALEDLTNATVRVDTYAKFNVGYVDASKRFFHPSVEAQLEYDLPAGRLLRAARSGRTLTGSGARTSYLPRSAVQHLWLADVETGLSDGEARYVAHGEQQNLHTDTMKLRNRTPWYRVPDVRVADLLMSVFGAFPRLIINDAQLVASNSLMLGFLRNGIDIERFVLAWYSSITRLGLELSVHSLGGGCMVVVPSEADATRMPPLPEIDPPSDLLNELDRALRANDLLAAYTVGDAYLELAGWKPEQIKSATEMADLLYKWRSDRGPQPI